MWEAFEHAAHFGLDNLTAIIDVNRLGQRGETMVGLGPRHVRLSRGGIRMERDRARRPRPRRDRRCAAVRPSRRRERPRFSSRARMKGKGVAAVENENGFHGKPLDDPDAAIAELGGLTDVRIEIAKPEAVVAERPAAGEARAPAIRARHRGRHAEGVRRRARSARRGATRRRRPRRRGLELDVRRDLREGAPGALLRDVHRRAAAGRGRSRPPGRGLATVRVDVRRLPLARVRLRAHGGDQPCDVLALRLARGRVDRRGRPVADGARGHRVAPRHPRIDGAPPL